MMETLEKQLTERLQRAAVDIPLPTAGAADDVRRGAARLRRRRGFEAGGAALAALAITGGLYAAGGPGDRATDSLPPVAEQETPAPSEDEPFIVEETDGMAVLPPDRPSEDEWEGYTYEPPQVQSALEDYEAAVLERLDPEGADGGPDLVAVPTDGFMGDEVRIRDDVATFVMDPSMLMLSFELGDGDRWSELSLSVEDVALGEQRSGETPPPGGWDDSCDPRPTCTPIDDEIVGNADGMVFEKDGALVGVTLERPDGITLSLALVDEHGKEELRLPWSSFDLIAVLVDPALELPVVD